MNVVLQSYIFFCYDLIYNVNVLRLDRDLICIIKQNIITLQSMKPIDYTINVRGRLIDLGSPKVMGISTVRPTVSMQAAANKPNMRLQNGPIRSSVKAER